MFENVHSTWQKHEILLRAVAKSDGSPTSEKQAMMQAQFKEINKVVYVSN